MGPLSSPSNVYSIPNSEPGKNTFLDDEEKGFAILMKKYQKMSVRQINTTFRD